MDLVSIFLCMQYYHLARYARKKFVNQTGLSFTYAVLYLSNCAVIVVFSAVEVLFSVGLSVC